jgi:hypothetical protein
MLAPPHGPAMGAVLAEPRGQHVPTVHTNVPAPRMQALLLDAPAITVVGGAGAEMGCTCCTWVRTFGRRHSRSWA